MKDNRVDFTPEPHFWGKKQQENEVSMMPVDQETEMAKSPNAATGNKSGTPGNAYGQARKATVQARNAARKAAKTATPRTPKMK